MAHIAGYEDKLMLKRRRSDQEVEIAEWLPGSSESTTEITESSHDLN
jgi:hypothetical protein